MTTPAELSERTPLRIKLIAATLALVAVALAVFGAGSVSVLHDYLIERVDGQLNSFTLELERRLQRVPVRPIAPRIPPEGLVRIRDVNGTLVYSLAGPQVEGVAWPAASASQPYVAETVDALGGEGRWRVRTVQIPSVGTLETAIDLASVDQIIVRLVTIELLVGGAVLAVLVGVGVVIVRRSLRPLEEIERTAEAIAGGQLSLRVPDRDPRTEVGRLGRSLNGMLTQIETAFRDRAASEAAARQSEDRMRRFIADASHELRTPLTSIRGFAEFFRQNPGADPVRLMARVEAQASRMGLLVDDLLLLARLDQQRPLQAQSVDLLAIAADAVHDARVLAADREVSLSVEGTAALLVTGDEVRLRQVVGNLMTNALAHTPPGTPVTVRVGTRALNRRPLPGGDPDAAFIEVSDKGPGLTPEQAERVFERFYRADPSRTRRTPERSSSSTTTAGGSGLGLSIVAALVKAHGGTVSVETAPGAGATFRVVLPLSPEAIGHEPEGPFGHDPFEAFAPGPSGMLGHESPTALGTAPPEARERIPPEALGHVPSPAPDPGRVAALGHGYSEAFGPGRSGVLGQRASEALGHASPETLGPGRSEVLGHGYSEALERKSPEGRGRKFPRAFGHGSSA